MTSPAYDLDTPIDLVPNQATCPVLHAVVRAYDEQAGAKADFEAAREAYFRSYGRGKAKHSTTVDSCARTVAASAASSGSKPALDEVALVSS